MNVPTPPRSLSLQEVTIPVGGRHVSGLWLEALEPRAVVVLAHGANGDMRGPLLSGVAASLGERQTHVLRFNFPYAEDGRRSPDRPPVLLAAWRAALDLARQRAEGLPLVAAGKSMGGRMASMVAAEMGAGFPAGALVFLGYPLHPPGRPDQRREEHLFSVRVPMLFIQGTADPLARLELVGDLVKRLGAAARLHVVEAADHSFRTRGRRRAPDEIGSQLGDVVASFVAQLAVAG